MIICIALISSSGFDQPCYGLGPNLKIKGLTEDVYYKLCGTWSFWGKSYVKETSDTELGWGTGKVGQDSLIIDFGDKHTSDIKNWYDPPAIVFVGDPPFSILSVETIDKRIYKINGKGKSFDRNKWINKKFSLIFHLNEDGTMWIEKNNFILSGKDEMYSKISGPVKP